MSVTTIQAILIAGTGLLLILLMLSDFLRHKVDLLSFRNILLLGFIVYQVISPSAVLLTNDTQSFGIRDLADAGWQYIVLMVPFLITFLVAYRYGWFVRNLAYKVPMYNKELSDGAMLVAAVVGTVIAMGARLTPAPIAIAYALYFIAMGASTMSTGLVTWWWMRRPGNLMRGAMTGILLLLNMMIVVYGSFSRRPLIAIMLMFIWVVYYTRLRYTPNRFKMLVWLGVTLVPLIILASLFTSARQQEYREMSSVQIVKLIVRDGKVTDGFIDLMGGQLVGEASLWCTEVFPEHLPQDHLLTLRYYFMANIPRDLWEDKPYVLSARVANLADIEGVRQDRAKGGQGITMPPGIVGYIAAEGGFYAALIYGLVLGLAARFLDQLAVNHPYRIGIIIPLAASLGNILGLLRGDPAQFAMGATWAILASFFLVFAITLAVGRRVYAQPPLRAQPA